jgi:uncharacterized protein YndB with AHSA1/START domain
MAKPRHVFETYIKATPEQVWEALIRPEFTKRYFFHTAINCGWEPSADSRNVPYTYDMEDGSAAIQGSILEAVPPSRLVMSFQMLFTPELAAEPASKVTWELTQVGDACRLTCIHGDLAFSPVTWAATASGWSVVLQSLKTLIETGEDIGEIPDDGKSPFSPQRPADIEWHRTLGAECNNATHELVEQPVRSDDETLRMIHQAHAAAYHWRIAGTIENWARAEYMCSRAYSFAGRSEPALFHASMCRKYVDQAGLLDWDLAFAHEAMARALACSGDLEGARRERALARAVPVADPEDKAIVDADIDGGPWFGV